MSNDSAALTFETLIACSRRRFETLTDPRRRITEDSFPLVDVLMCGLAMFHFQDPSLLRFQKALEDSERRSNLTTMFGVAKVPKDTQMRTLLDGVVPAELVQAFEDIHRLTTAGKLTARYRVMNGYYAVAVDASEYFSSGACHCKNCLEAKSSSDGTIRYHHQILQAALIKPGLRQVLPIGSEEVCRQDGFTKQDCELNAAKRLLPRLKAGHPHMDIIIVTDGLYSHVPFVVLVRELGFAFILGAKPTDHAAMYEDIEGLRKANAVGRIEKVDGRQRKHVYEWCNDVILRADAVHKANWFSYRLINSDGKIVYENSWVTSFRVTARNVADLVDCGRSRWKIENEGFNTLKNHGYHLEHNYGHGKTHLSYVLFLLNLLAFTIHQILEARDHLLLKLYEKVGAWREVWIKLRVMVETFTFDSWQQLLTFLLDKRPRHAATLM